MSLTLLYHHYLQPPQPILVVLESLRGGREKQAKILGKFSEGEGGGVERKITIFILEFGQP